MPFLLFYGNLNPMGLDPRLLRLIKPHGRLFAATIALGLAIGVLTICQARVLSHVISQVFLYEETLLSISKLLVWLLIILLARAGMIWTGEVIAKHLANRIKSDLRHQLLNHIQSLGPVYVGHERSGELTHLATEGIEALDAYFSQFLPQFTLALFVPLTFLLFIFPLDVLSALVMLLTAPLIPIFMILIGNMGNSLTKKQWQTLSLMSAHLTDIFQGLTTLKIFGRSQEQTQIIAQVSERYRKTTLEVMRITFLSALALEMIATLSTAIVAVEIGLRLLYGHLEFEQAFFVLLIAPEFYLPLRMLGVRFHAAMSGTDAAKRIFAVLNTVSKDVAEKPNTIQVMPPYRSFPDNQTSQTLGSPPRIVFHQVGCTYPDGRTALREVSFEIDSGQKVALVGPSGAGKSTIAYLLLRFITPTHGQITINEQPLDQIPLEEWRKQIAWLPQNPYLFHDTVLENIRLGRPEARLEEIIQAAKMAGAHEFIANLPQGYNTLLGERGARLSAGEAQRIALARAFLSNAPLIILDEPTANLDPETEESITQVQARLLNGRTTLIIAHRLNTIRNADLVIVLNEGRIEQIGTHTSLSQQSGLYQRLVSRYAEQSTISVPSPPNPISLPQPIQEEAIAPIDATVEPLPSSVKIGSITILLRLLSLLKPFTREIALSILLGFATIASSIGLMSTSAYIISMAALKPSIAVLQVAIVGVRAFGVGRGIFRYLERLVSHNVTFHLLAKLRTWFYQALEPLAPARLLSTHTGDLLSRVIADIASLENFYVRTVAPPFVALLTELSACFLLAWFHPSIPKVLIPFYLIASIGVPLAIHLLSRHPNQRLSTIRTKLYSSIMDGIQGIPDLQTYRAQKKYLSDIKCAMKEFNRVLVSLACIGGLQNALGFLAAHLCSWTALWLVIPLTNLGELNGVFLGVIVLAILTSFEAILPLPQAAQYFENSLQAARRLFEVTSSPPEVKDTSAPLTLPESTPLPPFRLTARNLCFRYPSSNSYALAGITFDLPPGKRIAIVGPSGSGKTTLVNLLLRFWEFSEGEIMIDGKDIRGYKQEDVRRLMSVVSQNTYLFNASIRENLLIARPQANQDEIEHATKIAQIYKFICSLPQGFDTRIGERGLLLSAGERQRLALARALLKNAPLLILDEPTANLDSLTEQQVMQSIYELMEHRTTLLITHRLVMMDHMDEILVLRHGRVVERGTHANLLKLAGYYYRMWYLQSQMLPMVYATQSS